jgi:hypothetical protein
MHSKPMGRLFRRTDGGYKLRFLGGLWPIPLGGGPPLSASNRRCHTSFNDPDPVRARRGKNQSVWPVVNRA